MIDHPEHYMRETGFEVIDVIEAWNLDFSLGNAIKYIARAGKKDPAKRKQDLEKAKHYIDMIIERDYPTTPIKEKDEKPPETSHADWIKGYKEWKKNK